MSNFQVINYDEFKDKFWKQVPDFSLFAKETVCPLTAQELPKALLDMPIGFIRNDDAFGIVGVQGVLPGHNLFVNEAGGWLGNYVPAHYRTYPFVLAKNTAAADQLVFCIDGDSGLITDDATHVPFFKSDGSLSDLPQQVFDLLEALHNNRVITEIICNKLGEKGLIKPWQLEVQLSGGLQKIEGLFAIDEVALNELDGDSILELKAAGALPVIYCQLISMQSIERLLARV